MRLRAIRSVKDLENPAQGVDGVLLLLHLTDFVESVCIF